MVGKQMKHKKKEKKQVKRRGSGGNFSRKGSSK
jgi:hypothetical protein